MERILTYLKTLEGNSASYDLATVPQTESSLCGKRILFLGSSVTVGFAALGTSFVDYVAKRNGAICKKEAVSGTTLVNNGASSYLERLKTVDATEHYDLFVCQLSTNDATQKYPVADITNAIRDIVQYAKATWHCPVALYTNCYYPNAEYAQMVDALNAVKEELGVYVLDLYNDEKFNDVTNEQRKLYMLDQIHPTKAGYLLWWTPKVEEFLKEVLK